QASHRTGAARDRHDFSQPHGSAELRCEKQGFARVVFSTLGGGKPIEQSSPNHEPHADGGIKTPGQQQDGPYTDEAEGGSFPRGESEAIHPELSLARKWLHAVVITPAARSTDRDNCIGTLGGH